MEVNFAEVKESFIKLYPKIAVACGVMFIFYIIALSVKNMLLNKINNNEKNPDNKNKILYKLLSDIFYYLILLSGLIITLPIAGINLSSIFIVFGSVGLAIALSMQGTMTQLVSGIVIISFNYFNIGDIVKIKDTVGYIHDFNLFNTTLVDTKLAKTVIPNSIITSSTFVNLFGTKEVKAEFVVTLSNNNNKLKYKKILSDLKNVLIKKCKYIVNKNVSVKIYDIGSSGSTVKIKFLVNNKKEYFDALASGKLIVITFMNDNNIRLLDNHYLK
jgi:small conductance mechanosensitive channel